MQETPTAEGNSPAEKNWVEINLDRFATDLSPAGSHTLKNLVLVLEARGIPCLPLPSRKPRRLLVQADTLAAAEREITLYLQENRSLLQAPQRLVHADDNTLQTLSILILIAIFHNLTYLHLSGFGHHPIDWLQLGSADSNLIRSGEWWRTITALTLHADGRHLLGNLLIGGYFVIRLCRLLGGGLGWNLILWSGVFGNAVNALLHVNGHRSVGASTALFGAIGAAGIIGLLRQRRVKSRYWVLPVAAALGLLAMLGAGSGEPSTDIGAHLFGFGCGMVLGAVAGRWILQYGLPSARANRLLAGVAMVVIIEAWLLALTA